MAEEDISQQGAATEGKPAVYKPEYSKDEVKSLLAWFAERMDRLPATMQLDPATRTADLPRTVRAFSALLKAQADGVTSVTFSGYVAHLELIRQRLKEQGVE